MTLPKRLRVGPYSYTVANDADTANRVCREREADLLGHTDSRALLIMVEPDQAPGQARDTILHEALHALMSLGNVYDDPKREEEVVSQLSPLLLDLLRRNPKLVAFLLD